MASATNHITIKKSASKAVIDFIKSEISHKKKRHEEVLRTIDPATVRSLKKMRKVGVSK